MTTQALDRTAVPSTTSKTLAVPEDEVLVETSAVVLPPDAAAPERISRFGDVSTQHVRDDTPMGATLIANGATFRVWAPNAIEVHVRVADRPDAINFPGETWQPSNGSRLAPLANGHWAGFVPGVRDGDFYRFYIVGRTLPYKRDPYARELEFNGYPDCDCIVRDPHTYPWHDQDWQPPRFNDLIVYEFHIGTFYAVDDQGRDRRSGRIAKLLDALDRLEYLAALGVNAIEPLPVVEFQTETSRGYNGTDLFSPEMDYCVPPAELEPYLQKVNALLAQRGQPPLERRHLEGQVNQLKTFVDLCHLFGIAVVLDVVYNHAGGAFDDQSIHFFDREPTGNNADSIYFSGAGHAGGLVFDFDKPEVRQFLIDNARFFLDEYHVDGLRYDEVTVIDHHGGWRFAQDLTATVQFRKPEAVNIAEFWGSQEWVVKSRDERGAGFDAVWADGLRGAVRNCLAAAARGRDVHVPLDRIRDQLYRPAGFTASWRSVQHLENHDLLDVTHDDKQPRIAALAGGGDARSWYARSRSRVASGLLLTAPGIPMLYVGQEFLEDKFWSDNDEFHPGLLVWWDGLGLDRHMADHLRFTQDLSWLRRRHPALRGEPINVFHVHEANRVLAFHRWLEGVGRDVVVVASLNEATFGRYELGFPQPGRWREVFNSDVYDHFVNPQVAGNGGSIEADGGPLHGLPHSASIVIPANSLLVFARDAGD